MDNKITTPFGWKRHWEYIKVSIYILYKKLIEYKMNYWFMFVEQIIYSFTAFLFFNVMYTNFNTVIPW